MFQYDTLWRGLLVLNPWKEIDSLRKTNSLQAKYVDRLELMLDARDARVRELEQELSIEKSIVARLSLGLTGIVESSGTVEGVVEDAIPNAPQVPVEVEQAITHSWAGMPVAASLTRQQARIMLRDGVPQAEVKKRVRGNIISVE